MLIYAIHNHINSERNSCSLLKVLPFKMRKRKKNVFSLFAYLAQHNCSIKHIASRAFDLLKSDDVSWQQLSLSLILVKQ